jgi:hypothetical protein
MMVSLVPNPDSGIPNQMTLLSGLSVSSGGNSRPLAWCASTASGPAVRHGVASHAQLRATV